ncbi:MAG: type II toxin-antitoxin system ParD family antitoxin [Hoeflea sp.]|nr:type II toxin-antitoxin system ParD family antitoxin [Hoeflea sp.]
MSPANPTDEERLADLRRAIDAGDASGDAGPLDMDAFLAGLREPQPDPDQDKKGEGLNAPNG